MTLKVILPQTEPDYIEGMAYVTIYTQHYLSQEVKGFDQYMESFTFGEAVFLPVPDQSSIIPMWAKYIPLKESI
jgi:F0F1-type ATP synthase membrane subunit a